MVSEPREMPTKGKFVQPAIPRFDGHYDHGSMLMENFFRSKEYRKVVDSGIKEPEATATPSYSRKQN